MEDFVRLAVVGLFALVLSACSSEAPGPSTDDSSQASAPVIQKSPGEQAFLQCAACHGIAEQEGNKLGPNLAGVVGRKAGAVEGFQYSSALKDSGIVWTREDLDAFLTSPNAKVPGTKMVFAGIADAGRRQALIDYMAGAEGQGGQ